MVFLWRHLWLLVARRLYWLVVGKPHRPILNIYNVLCKTHWRPLHSGSSIKYPYHNKLYNKCKSNAVPTNKQFMKVSLSQTVLKIYMGVWHGPTLLSPPPTMHNLDVAVENAVFLSLKCPFHQQLCKHILKFNTGLWTLTWNLLVGLFKCKTNQIHKDSPAIVNLHL